MSSFNRGANNRKTDLMMTKRAHSPPLTGRGQSKIQRRIPNPAYNVIVDAIQQSGSLTPMCKEMLSTTLHLYLGIPSDKRSVEMIAMVDMVRQVLQAQKDELQAAVDEEESHIATQQSSKEQVFGNRIEADDAASAAQAAIGVHKNCLEEAQAVASECAAIATEAEESLHSAKLKANELENALADLHKAKDIHLPALTTDWDEKNASTHCAALLHGVHGHAEVVDAFRSSVENCFMKAPATRGQFDAMILDELQKVFATHAVDIAEMIEAGNANLVQLEQHVEEKRQELQHKQNAVDAITIALASATSEHANAVERQSLAMANINRFESALSDATRRREEKNANLERFVNNTIACFDDLVNKVSVATDTVVFVEESPKIEAMRLGA